MSRASRQRQGGWPSRLDFHCHSNRSDGARAPEVLLAAAAAGGLDVLAITDHDLPPSLPAGEQVIGGQRIRLVHGAEVTVGLGHHELHILVYFPGQMPSAFADFLRGRAARRAQRYDAMRAALDLPGVPAAGAEAHAGEVALTRHHLARALVAAGHADHVHDAFERYLGRRHGRVPPPDLDHADFFARVRADGGLSAWAHPSVDQALEHTASLARAGLHAMEVCRPGLNSYDHARLVRLALRHRLLQVGGSDDHGWGPKPIGGFCYPIRQARPFCRALGLIAH